jgi:group I intron endonuclease
MIIYKTTNTINGKFYIGKDKHNNPNYLGSGKRLNDAIKCYGKENFKKEVLEHCDTYEQMSEREIFWISELESLHPKGYNLALGGDGGDTISNHPKRDLIAKNHSDWMLENNPTRGRSKTQEEIDNWRESYGGKWEGEHNPNYGSTRSVETKQIQSEIRKEWHKNLSEEERKIISKKISESNKGKEGYWKGKTNENHSQWMTENNPFKGKTHTDEVKQMLSEINSKPKTNEHKENISLNSPNNKQCVIEGVTYRSVAAASRQLGLSENTVRGRVKNKNFKEWNYVETE